jgi:RNA polymerase sigma factor for flagellar operon FliA
MSFEGEKIEDVLKEYEPLVRFKSYAVYSKFNRQQCTLLLEDLYQAGRLGVVEAFNTYDSERGVPFSAFVVLRVTFAIYAEVTSNVQYERHTAKALQHLQNDKRNAEIIYGRAVTDEELADFIGEDGKVFTARIHKQQESVPWMVSIGELLDDLPETVAHKDVICAEDIVYQRELKSIISECLAYLTPIERRVVRETFFQQFSLEKIGLSLGVSKQRVFIVRERALRKIQAHLRRKGFVWPGVSDA